MIKFSMCPSSITTIEMVTDKLIILQTLLGLAASEWIEITKVGGKNDKSSGVGSSKTAAYTVPSYEITLNRPQINEIKSNDTEDEAAQSPRENISEHSRNNNLKNKAENLEKAHIDSDEMVAATFYPANEFEAGADSGTNPKIEDNDKHETVTFYTANEDEILGEHVDSDEDADVEDEEDENADINGSFSGLMSVVNHVQSQLLDFKGKSLDAKVEHLKKLRDNILYEIKHRISRLFQTSGESATNSRLFKDDEHYMDYPSNEGALITIGFLTFAVFLIKLVLKLVHALKFKEQYYYQTSTTPASIFLRKTQRKDGEPLEDSANILRYLEEYSP